MTPKLDSLAIGVVAGIVGVLSFLLGHPTVGLVAGVFAAAGFGGYLVLANNKDVLTK